MIIENFIRKFWQGKLKLWHSFWLVGFIGGIIVGKIIVFIEEKIFSSYSQSPFEFSLRGKLLVIVWIIFSTVGIWRSAEKYQGLVFWKISTKIYISINCISSILLLFFFNFPEIYTD